MSWFRWSFLSSTPSRGPWFDAAFRHRAGIVLTGLLVLAYSAGVLGYVLMTPELGLRCAFTPVVNHFYDDFLAADNQPLLRPNDRITRLGPYPVETWSQLLRATMFLGERPGEAMEGLTAKDLIGADERRLPSHIRTDGQSLVRVEYERPGESGIHRVWLRFGRSPPETFVPSIVWFFIKIGLFVVGAVLFWKKPDDPASSRFYWLCIVTLGAYMGGYHWSRIVTQPVLLVVFMACAVLLPAVTLHFYLVFPRIKPAYEARWRRVLLVLYGVPLFFLFLLLQGYLRLRFLHEGGIFAGVEPLIDDSADSTSGVRLLFKEMLYEIYIYFGVAAFWFGGCMLALLHSYRTAANPAERDQVRWILYGAAAAGVPICYTLYMAIFEQGRFGGGGATWPMFAASAFITLAYTFSMTRYRLMQLDRMISSGVVYFLISTLAGLIYYGIVFGLLMIGSRGHDGPSVWQAVGVASTALVLMVAMDMIRGRLLQVLDKHLKREKYQLDRTLQRMSQTIERLVDSPTLGRQVLQTTADLLSAPSGAIYLRQGEPALFQLSDAIGPPPRLTELPPGCPIIDTLGRTPVVQVDEKKTACARQVAFLGGSIALGMVHEGSLLGVLILGAREEGGDYTAEEVQILSAFARIAVPALVSAEGHRTIDGLNRDMRSKVEKIAEQQRRILALQSQLTKREKSVEPEVVGPVEAPDPTETGAQLSGLVGSGECVQQLTQLVRRVAASASAVLLRGESGTGKELVAKALHDNSPRAGRAFVKVHCAALSPGLLESELFGHVKGAFTSAIRDKVGRFESADGGTLFLDEIGDISLEVQTKLLRVLEEMTFERVGSSEPVHVDVRIIAATHRRLEEMIRAGTFREDLYFRLNVLPIRVPPLRERVEDIPELASHFLRVYANKLGKPVRLLDDDALAALKGYSWPGNIRQLENVIERAVVITEGGQVTTECLPAEVLEEGVERPLLSEDEVIATYDTMAERAERERREREHLVRALASAAGNKSEAARALGLARSTLVSKLKRFGLR